MVIVPFIVVGWYRQWYARVSPWLIAGTTSLPDLPARISPLVATWFAPAVMINW